jgi:hypothetical protein
MTSLPRFLSLGLLWLCVGCVAYPPNYGQQRERVDHEMLGEFERQSERIGTGASVPSGMSCAGATHRNAVRQNGPIEHPTVTVDGETAIGCSRGPFTPNASPLRDPQPVNIETPVS